MTNTTFINHDTVIASDWCNDVNDAVYEAIGDGTSAPTTAAEVRTNLSLGTAALVDTGTSGATIPLLNGNNTHSGNNTFSGTNTFSGQVYVTSGDSQVRGTGSSYLTIDADTDNSANADAVLQFRRNGLNRWLLYKSAVVESGSNAGSDFKLDRYDDAGTGIDTVLTISRANGNIGAAYTMSAAGTISILAGASQTTEGGELVLYPGSSYTDNLSFDRYADLGRFFFGTGPTILTITKGGGLQVGAPTGGDKGAGTLNVASGIYVNGTMIKSGTGSPEGVVTSAVGGLFLRTDGGANTTLYVKESGTGNTGWVAK